MRNLVRAEWAKLWSVRRWALALGSATVVSVLLGLLAASGSGTDANRHGIYMAGPDGTPVEDGFQFVHQPLAGDGSVIARVTGQANSHEWARAGVMIKEKAAAGARYASLAVTPEHGLRLQANFTRDLAVGDGMAPTWLKLTRMGTEFVGSVSSDGASWREVGRIGVTGLPQSVEAGIFVNSPPKIRIERQAGSTSVGKSPTKGNATFDNVRLEPGHGSGQWQSDTVIRPFTEKLDEPIGSSTEADGVFTVIGSGGIGPDEPDDDIVQIGLFGILGGVIAIIAVAVLFVTAEFKRGMMIRTTFAASPRRGRVLIAKSIVIAAVAFAAGVVAAVASFLVTQPILRDHGFAPPAFPVMSLWDVGVIRTIAATGLFVALVAVFSLGVGALLRHSAAAITSVIALLIGPAIVASMLPVEAARWLMRLTPAGGFATQRVKPPNDGLVEAWSMIPAWAGLVVVSVYAATALGAGLWSLRRRDV